MITRAVGEITRETAKHKFGGDPIAEYMYSTDNNLESGSVEWDFWFAQSGKRIVFESSSGHVWVNRYGTEALATEGFEWFDAQYGEWLDEGF